MMNCYTIQVFSCEQIPLESNNVCFFYLIVNIPIVTCHYHFMFEFSYLVVKMH